MVRYLMLELGEYGQDVGGQVIKVILLIWNGKESSLSSIMIQPLYRYDASSTLGDGIENDKHRPGGRVVTEALAEGLAIVERNFERVEHGANIRRGDDGIAENHIADTGSGNEKQIEAGGGGRSGGQGGEVCVDRVRICKGVDIGDEICIIKGHANGEGVIKKLGREKAGVRMEGVVGVCEEPSCDVGVGSGEMQGGAEARQDLFAEDRLCVTGERREHWRDGALW